MTPLDGAGPSMGLEISSICTDRGRADASRRRVAQVAFLLQVLSLKANCYSQGDLSRYSRGVYGETHCLNMIVTNSHKRYLGKGIGNLLWSLITTDCGAGCWPTCRIRWRAVEVHQQLHALNKRSRSSRLSGRNRRCFDASEHRAEPSSHIVRGGYREAFPLVDCSSLRRLPLFPPVNCTTVHGDVESLNLHAAYQFLLIKASEQLHDYRIWTTPSSCQ